MHGHKPFKTLFQQGTQIRGFDQKKNCGKLQNKLFISAKKKKKKIGVTAVHVHALKYLIVIPVFNKFLSKYFTIGQDFVNFRN